MFDTKKLLSRVKRWPSVFEQSMVLSSRRLSASGWYTQRGRARKSAERLLQLVVLSGALGALLVDWTQVHRFAGEVEARWSRHAVVPSAVVSSALADMGRELADAQLPIELNERVEHWMLRFSTWDKPEFEETLSRAGLYSDMIRGKLRARGMPEELVYLAMIESGFLTNARSRVLATGMWQFMDPTARAYGLQIDRYVDERRDPVRATDAALQYLSDLYQQYGSWYLAAAAYNAGPTRVSLALARRSGVRAGNENLHGAGEGNLYGEGDENLYWEIVDHLPKETAQYVPRLLAATYLARYADRFDLDVTLADPYMYDLVWAPGATSLADVGETMGLPDDRMRELNPQLIRGMTPPGNVYPLRVPLGRAYQAMAALAAPDPRSRLADD
jgi:membrane-bound lytic murein transglycosylase D